MRVYVDTNIIMDYLLGRNPTSFFSEAILCKYTVCISNLIMQELKYQNLTKESKIFFQWIDSCKKLTLLQISNKDKKLAKTFLDKTHHNDAIHAACAITNNVDFLLTRNIKDFEKLPLNIKHPDEI